MFIDQLTYTDAKIGEALDPSHRGYQIKACSAGIAPEEQRLLNRICEHYFGTLYDCASGARAKEGQWRKGQHGDTMPDELLAEFPEVWTYLSLGTGRFALTHCRYAGFTVSDQVRRPGNYFIHSLVLDPACLGNFEDNPLLFAGTSGRDLFQLSTSAQGKTLPSISITSLGKVSHSDSFRVLSRDRIRAEVAALITALGDALTTGRTVVVQLESWRDGCGFVQELLELLPSQARGRTAFCTGEPERRWRPLGQPSEPQTSYHLVVNGGGGGRLAVAPDEISFDFTAPPASKRASVETSPYSVMAAGAVDDPGRLGQLRRYHDLLATLELDGTPRAWSDLCAASELPEACDNFAGACQALASYAKVPAQAFTSLSLLLPYTSKLAKGDDAATLAAASPGIAKICDMIPNGNSGFGGDLQDLAQNAFIGGRGRTVRALLDAMGKRRADTLNTLLTSCTAKQASARLEDRTAIVDLFLEGLVVLDKPSSNWMVQLFTAAAGTDRLSEVWEKTVDTVVSPIFGDGLSEDNCSLLETLLKTVQGRSADAEFWLRVTSLTRKNLNEEEFLNALLGFAKVSLDAKNVEGLKAKIGSLIEERLSKAKQTEALGILSSILPKTSELQAEYFRKYRAGISAESDKFAIRKALSERLCIRTLSDDFLCDTLPWDEERGRETFSAWADRLFPFSIKVCSEVCAAVADRLVEPWDAVPLAVEILGKRLGEGTDGFGRLFGATVLALPIRELDRAWRQTLERPPSNLTPAAKDRLGLLKLLAKYKDESSQPDWSLARFDFKSPAWLKTASLTPQQRLKLLNWVVAIFDVPGLTTPAEARALIDLMSTAQAGEPGSVAEVTWRLVADRDDVTRVLGITAFVQCYLETERATVPEIVAALVDRLDRGTRALLEAHISRRPGFRDDKVNRRLAHVCNVAGLDPPRPQQRSSRKESDPKSLPTSAPSAVSQMLGKLFGRQTTPTSDSENARRSSKERPRD